MGLFDSIKKCNCTVCNKQITVKEAAINVRNSIFLCAECNAYFNKYHVTPLWDKMLIKAAKTELLQRAEKYKDTFNPQIHVHNIYIDPDNGLFACGKTYEAGQNPIFSFSEFDFDFLFKHLDTKKAGKNYNATGYYYLKAGITDWSNKNKKYYLEIPISAVHETLSYNIYDNENFYALNPDYADGVAEVIHQFLRNASPEAYHKMFTGLVVGDYDSYCGTFMLCYYKPTSISHTEFGFRYAYINSKFDRKSTDPKEILACQRLDENFAYCLAFCEENIDYWNEVTGEYENYTSNKNFDIMIYAIEPYLAEIKNWWTNPATKDTGSMISHATQGLIEQARDNT